MPDLRLGLIGDNIKSSSAPRFHELAGQQNGIKVQYDRLIPLEMNLTFNEVFEQCADSGYNAINITYPYKELAAAKVAIENPTIKQIGAVNTILFTESGAQGFNTDYSGFIGSYKGVRGDTAPGIVGMIGTGGVGRAIAFGLLTLGAEEIRLLDKDLAKAKVLATALQETGTQTRIVTVDTLEELTNGATGLINSTPVGMVGYPGTPVPKPLMAGAKWAFDAVYTPINTEFLQAAEAMDLQIISGFDLFFNQALDSWEIFSGVPVDSEKMKSTILECKS